MLNKYTLHKLRDKLADEEKIESAIDVQVSLESAHLLLLMSVIFLALFGFGLVDSGFYGLSIIVGVIIGLITKAGFIIHEVSNKLVED